MTTPNAATLSDALPDVWMVWSNDGPDVSFTVAASAHEHANIMASDFPELGPWRVRRFVDAAGAASVRAVPVGECDGCGEVKTLMYCKVCFDQPLAMPADDEQLITNQGVAALSAAPTGEKV